MICQKCKKAVAAVCISQVVNNYEVDVYLCRDCANEQAENGLKAALGWMNGFPGHLIFGGGIGADSFGPYTEKPKSVDVCPTCAKSFAEIRKDGKIGCAQCYSVFRERLKPMVERIHGGAVHKGAIPSPVSERNKTESAINDLRAMLDQAVAEEAYERAAELRDMIRGIEQQGNGKR